MADQEHVDTLKRGAKVWNQWREKHPNITPELSEVDLSETDLSHALLSGADLYGANLCSANLSFTNLHEADLSAADLVGAILMEAYLGGADLYEADLTEANLIEADLRGANLVATNLNKATVGWTIFGSVDLSMVEGLETVEYFGPSTIGIDTIYLSHGNIPEAFLKGAGVDDAFISYIRSQVGKAIEYYSCFISYSSKDDAFARRLYADLQSNNVRCWYAPEDMKAGDVIRSRIDEAIRVHDKLLLVLSRHSVESSWVEKEVETAFEKERQQKRHVLFPVRLDNAVMQTSTSWAADIRRMRHITDFTKWKDYSAYQKAFARLLRDLKAEI